MVRPGDNATLLCDREIVGGQDTHWVKICSSQIQPPLIVSAQLTLLLPIPRFSVLWNNASKSYDLMIENITDSDLGLFYCATVEKQLIEHDRLPFEKEVYHTGDTLTKLAYASTDDNECLGSSGKCLLNIMNEFILQYMYCSKNSMQVNTFLHR